MTLQARSLGHDVPRFSIEQAEREYLSERQETPLRKQSATRPYNSSLPPLLLRALTLGERPTDTCSSFLRTLEHAQSGEWLETALAELNDIDREVAAESLPEIISRTKDQARRILFALATQTVIPTVYPTEDGEIALYFKPPAARSAVFIVVANDGQAACFSYVNGKNRRARYEDASELPDDFVREQLRRLASTLT
ncbi:MAG: hypothetical protein OXF11_09245 [Deltaproteobacteria bacterium]|nr:hypothetical protein [Deltaproteobacteria bacterium]